jgi:hypothetical protein
MNSMYTNLIAFHFEIQVTRHRSLFHDETNSSLWF